FGGRNVIVSVPPNAYNGQVLHIEGQGEPSPAGGPAGTLHVNINVTQYQQVPPPPPVRPPYQQVPPPPPVRPPYQQVPQRVMQQPPPTPQKPSRGVWFVLGIIGGIILVFFLCAIVLSALSH